MMRLLLLCSVIVLATSSIVSSAPMFDLYLGAAGVVRVNASMKERLLKPPLRPAYGSAFADLTQHRKVALPLDDDSSLPTNTTHQTLVEALLSRISTDRARKTITLMSAMYNRHYTTELGLAASKLVHQMFSSVSSPSSQVLDVAFFDHAAFPQKSVIATLHGQVEETIILGAHLDSITHGEVGEDSRAPGADDDASGVALVLEVATLLLYADFKPYYTIEFHSYAAEEGGLLGSLDIAQSYRDAGRQVRGMLQLDQAAYLADPEHPTIGILRDIGNVSLPLSNFLEECVKTYSPETEIGAAHCGYACSDQWSWNHYGFPACHESEGVPLFSNTSPYAHSANDTISTISFPHWEQLTRVACGWVVELSFQ